MIKIFTGREAKALLDKKNSISLQHQSKGKNRTVTLTDFYRCQLETAPDRPANISRIGPICSLFSTKLFEPFLDIQVVELATRLPPSLKQPSMNEDKLILRKMAREYKLLPREFRQRKMGLSAPLDGWYEGELREWVHQSLLDNLPSFFDRNYVKTLLERKSYLDRIYAKSVTYRTSSRDIFALLMLALWFKEYSPEVVC
jgi:asparagine synthetase B (glutamine-hydrolysing)